MKLRSQLALTAICALSLLGCDKKEEGKASSGSAPAAAAPTMADKAVEAASGAAAAAKEQAGKAVEAVKETAVKATEQVKQQAAAAVDSAKAAASPLVDEAKGWVTKATDSIKANNLADAKTYLDKLEAVKGQLPQWLQDQIANLTTLYEAAKAKGLIPGGVKIP